MIQQFLQEESIMQHVLLSLPPILHSFDSGRSHFEGVQVFLSVLSPS